MTNPAVHHRTTPSSKWVVLGKVVAAFGIQGWVKVQSYTAPPENLFHYENLKLLRATSKNVQLIDFEQFKPHKKGFIAKLKRIHDRTDAEQIQYCTIVIARDELPELPDDEFYWDDLIGLSVLTDKEEPLGKVSHLFETGANDVLVVVGERERLIPFVLDEIVLAIDLQKGILVVNWDKDF